jgi:hypothetical protein
MPPGEIWWLVDAKGPQRADVAEVEDLYQMMMGA